MTGTILNAVTAAVMAVWPFFVLYAVTNGLMTLLLAGTACVLGVRLALALAGRGETARSGRLLSAAGLVLVGLAALLDEADWMLWYPVLVNASLLSVFGASLFSGMPVVERLARLGLRGKPLPPEGVAYTRRVTAVWCGFFVVNGSIAVATILADDLTLWALWNGGLSYVAIGCLMGGEYLYRKLVKHVGCQAPSRRRLARRPP